MWKRLPDDNGSVIGGLLGKMDAYAQGLFGRKDPADISMNAATGRRSNLNLFMKAELKVLMLEDDVNDFELVKRQLRLGGFPVRMHRVVSQRDFVDILADDAPDIILSDHGLPGFNGFEAMAVAKQKRPHIPFVFVTGLSGAEKEVETFMRGGIDYVLKNRLVELVPVVKRVLHKAEQQAERRQREQAWQLGGGPFRALVDGVRHYAICRLDREGRVTTWNLGAAEIKGYEEAEILGQHFSHFYPAESVAEGQPAQALARAFTEGGCKEETVLVRKGGAPFWAEVVLAPLPDETAGVCGFVLVVSDITFRKEMEDKRERMIQELQGVLNSVKILSGQMPVCVACKKVRDYQGQWHPLDVYLSEHSEASMVDKVCEECAGVVAETSQ